MKKTLIFLSALLTLCVPLTSCSSVVKDVSSPEISSEASKINNDSESKPAAAEIQLTESYRSEKIQGPDMLNTVYSIEKLDNGDIIFFGSNNDGRIAYVRCSSAMNDFALIEPEMPDEYSSSDDGGYTLHFNSDGSFIASVTIEDHGGVKIPKEYDENFDYESYYMNCITKTLICVYDKSGKLLSSAEINYPDDFYDDYGYLAIADSIADGNTLLQTRDNGSVYRVDSSGNVNEIFKTDGSLYYYANRFFRDRDGDIIFGLQCESVLKTDDMIHANDSMKMYRVGSDFQLGEPVYTLTDVLNDMQAQTSAGTGEYLLYIPTKDGLMGIRDDGTSDTVINWNDSDLKPLQAVCVGENEFLGLEINYTNGKGTLMRLTPRDPSEFADVKILTAASPSGYYPIEIINEFNSSQSKYRIKTLQYSSDDPFFEGESSQLNIDIATGNAPDIILGLDYSNYMNLRSKGLFTDLYALMDGDSELSKDDIMPPLLRAFDGKDGTLRGITGSYRVDSRVIKKKFWDKENWTLDEMISVYDNAPSYVDHLYDDTTKSEEFSNLSFVMYDFIDYDNASCSFDCPKFIKLLNFCDRFLMNPERPSKDSNGEWDRYMIDKQSWFMNDNILDMRASVSNPTEYPLTKYLEGGGDDIIYVGYPSNDGKGGRIYPESIYAISEKCSDKEGAWAFLKALLLDEDKKLSKSEYHERIPLRTETYVAGLDAELNAHHTAQSREIPQLTMEERDYIYNYIMSCDTIGARLNKSMENILDEESGLFFAGEQSAEAAAEHIQNRMTILLSEQS